MSTVWGDLLRLPAILFISLLIAGCTLQSAAPPTPTSPPPTVSTGATATALPDATGGITINPGRPTALPDANAPSDGIIANDGEILCGVRNANDLSNVAVRREPNTSSELFYAIQPGFTASVIEVRQVTGSVPWYRVRIDNPIETDLEVVEGWVRSDTVVQTSICPGG
ncbi:MAG: SH3 domain-containing protein [Chloroflexota bacterium]